MSDNFFTLMIIPNRKSGVKKISVPKKVIRNILIGCVALILVTLFVIYDYASIKRDRAELARLRQQTQKQSQEFRELAMKIDAFSDQMERLRQLDKKVRILASYQTGKDKNLLVGIGGSDDETKVRDLLNAEHEKLIEGMRSSIAKLNEDAAERERSFQELLAFLHEQKSILASTPSLWPIRGWVTSEFGWRESPFRKGMEFHNGIDIAARFGAPILAPADGLVIQSSSGSQEGNMIKIEHGHGFSTCYAHLSKIAVKVGSRVKKGTVIGYVGDTGRSTGSHLHYMVLVNDIAVNPKKYLR
ncbi:MAG TPA: M23 family metallopeptidase [Smithella sp.]|nr:M23 family metallopeptidase [Smithella sp.]